MTSMFQGCVSLESINLNAINVKNNIATNFTSMFYGCTAIRSIDMSGWAPKGGTAATNMFYNCKELNSAYVGSSWGRTSPLSGGNIFYGCVNIVGASGYKFRTSNVGAGRPTWALRATCAQG